MINIVNKLIIFITLNAEILCWNRTNKIPATTSEGTTSKKPYYYVY